MTVNGELVDLGIAAPRQTPVEAFVKRRDEARQRILGKK